MKTIRRQVLIREKDYMEKLKPQALSYNLYDRAEWVPLSRKTMEQENMWAQLSNQNPVWDLDRGWTYDYKTSTTNLPLYNPRYNQWKVWAEGDEMWIEPDNHNGKPSRLGISTLEKDT